jgi:hypothetical protein
MLDVMYELPERGRGCRYVISKEVVDGRQPVFPIPTEPKTKSA